MTYRTRTYIAGDWTGDKNAIDQLHKWNDSNFWGLSFTDAHGLHQSNDSSLNCSIKKSLCQRMDASKTFVLVVGAKTKSLTAGSCQHCTNYSGLLGCCYRGYSVSLKSYIEYECDKAARDGLKIIVLYNSTSIDRNLCPDSVRRIGVHANMQKRENGNLYWDYRSVKDAFDKATK
ncbi:MAG: TIR domain-containing protein [Prevotella sp.]